VESATDVEEDRGLVAVDARRPHKLRAPASIRPPARFTYGLEENGERLKHRGRGPHHARQDQGDAEE